MDLKRSHPLHGPRLVVGCWSPSFLLLVSWALCQATMTSSGHNQAAFYPGNVIFKSHTKALRLGGTTWRTKPQLLRQPTLTTALSRKNADNSFEKLEKQQTKSQENKDAEASLSRRTLLMSTLCIATLLEGGWTPAISAASASERLKDMSMSQTDTLVDQKLNADPTMLLRRLKKADLELDTIGLLVDQGKWLRILQLIQSEPLSQDLTGSLEQIIAATPVDDNNNGSSKMQTAVDQLLSDVRAIGRAAEVQDATACKQATEKAVRHLESVVQVAYCQSDTMVCFDASSASLNNNGNGRSFQEQLQARQESMDNLTEKLLHTQP